MFGAADLSDGPCSLSNRAIVSNGVVQLPAGLQIHFL